MNKHTKNAEINKRAMRSLIKIFLVVFILKSIIAYFITYPFSPDVYQYTKMAQSFFESGTFTVNGIPSNIYPPLYPIIISIAYLFKDYNHIYFSMQIINIFLTTLMIVPSFLIARNFMDDKNSIIVVSIISLLPFNFFFPIGYILSENLYNFLFLFMVYFLHKSLTENSRKWQMVAGLLLGLCILTRYIAFSVFPAVILALFIKNIYYSDSRSIKQILTDFSKSIYNYLPFFTIAVVTFIPWIIRNVLIAGFNQQGAMGVYDSEITAMGESIFIGIPFFSRLFMEFFAHVGALVYASGVILFAMSLFLINYVIKTKPCDKSLSDFIIISLSMTIMAVLLSAYHNALLIDLPYIRMQPRYIEVVLPLIYITGYLGLIKYQQNVKNLLSFKLTPYFLLSFLLMIFLLPVSYVYCVNLSHFTLQAVDKLYAMDMLFGASIALIKILIFVVVTSIWLLLDRKKLLTLKSVTIIIVMMLLLTNVIGIAGRIIYTNENYTTEIGTWYNSNAPDNPGIVLFDEHDTKYLLPRIGFWINAPIIVGNVTSQRENIDYIISLDTLDLQILATEKLQNETMNDEENSLNEVYLYKV